MPDPQTEDTMPAGTSLAPLFPDWGQYNDRLIAAVRDLSTDQLAIRASPDHFPIWALTAHTAGARTFWLCTVIGEPGIERTPFTDPTGFGWEDDPDHPRDAAELVGALESTWSVVADCLARWMVASLDDVVERRGATGIQYHTKASILSRLMTHDAFHAGEISQLLGVHRLPEIDLWARDRSVRPG
jgi:uncharacterized damage-inducible protein DinB